jgi:hypothetical protein
MRVALRNARRVGMLAAVLAVGGSAGVLAQPAAAAGTPLVGTFTITPGSCSGGVASGTYLRMVLSGGTNTAGPYFSNSDSGCSDNSYTPLAPGSSGGLVTGSYQPQPSPAFDGQGNALSSQVTAPVAFEGVKFSVATNPVDPQTGLHVPAPSITLSGTSLSGNVQSFGVSWNNQEFNQGSPKPDGSTPGNTTPVVGTYNPSSGAYTLQWSSQVVGGPFNGFSAFWNLTGRFIPAGSGASPSSGAAGSPAGAAAPNSGQSTGAAAASSGNAGSSRSGAAVKTTTGTTAAGSSAASAATTSTTSAGASRTITKTRTVLSVRSIAGSSGWSAPDWLLALVAVLAALGLGGFLWTERQLRQRRRSDEFELKGA